MVVAGNAFKAALAAGQAQIGLWLALADPYAAELCGGAGFDWLLIDGEHAPNDVRSILAQLQAVEASPSHAVVRVPVAEPWMLKQILDIGARTVLVPMIETVDQALATVRAVRYPPRGMRGVGAALARASAFNRRPDYLRSADDEICLLLQIESRAGLRSLDEIAVLDGVDGVFIGPADLAADMGHIGNPGAPEVQEAVEDALTRIIGHGKAAGILTSDQKLARRYRDLGATFIAVGTDVTLLVGATNSLANAFKEGASPASSGNSASY